MRVGKSTLTEQVSASEPLLSSSETEEHLTYRAVAHSNSQKLVEWFHFAAARYVIALSGGVDSAVVAKAAALAAESNRHIEVILATGESPSLARQELDDAKLTADLVQLEHLVVATAETQRSDYKRNDARRCYYCKSQLFATLEHEFPGTMIITGTNADDLGDYRPGLIAATEHHVRSPLAELGLGKAQVRGIAQLWQLPIAEKPASPCLASRIAYGLEVTHERLAMIEQAEAYLRTLGLNELRVRLHPGDMARIEVPVSELALLVSAPHRNDLLAKLKSFGFRFVTLDLAGFASGSLNQLIQISPRD